MGVDKRTVQLGNGVDWPRKGDNVTMEYTGWIYDPTKPENKGGDRP
jgi:FK506-binding protein 1